MAARVQNRLRARIEAKSSGALKKSSIFADLSDMEIGKLVDVMEYEKFDSGSIVCREGTPAVKMYLILSGECEVFDGGLTVEDESDDVVICNLKENDIFGESALFPDENGENVPRRNKTVRVKQGCVLQVLSMESVDFFNALSDGTLNEETCSKLENVARMRREQDKKRLAETIEPTHRT